jgi:hypothetical protein
MSVVDPEDPASAAPTVIEPPQNRNAAARSKATTRCNFVFFIGFPS